MGHFYCDRDYLETGIRFLQCWERVRLSNPSDRSLSVFVFTDKYKQNYTISKPDNIQKNLFMLLLNL